MKTLLRALIRLFRKTSAPEALWLSGSTWRELLDKANESQLAELLEKYDFQARIPTMTQDGSIDQSVPRSTGNAGSYLLKERITDDPLGLVCDAKGFSAKMLKRLAQSSASKLDHLLYDITADLFADGNSVSEKARMETARFLLEAVCDSKPGDEVALGQRMTTLCYAAAPLGALGYIDPKSAKAKVRIQKLIPQELNKDPKAQESLRAEANLWLATKNLDVLDEVLLFMGIGAWDRTQAGNNNAAIGQLDEAINGMGAKSLFRSRIILLGSIVRKNFATDDAIQDALLELLASSQELNGDPDRLITKLFLENSNPSSLDRLATPETPGPNGKKRFTFPPNQVADFLSTRTKAQARAIPQQTLQNLLRHKEAAIRNGALECIKNSKT